MAASATPICRSGRSPIPAPALTAVAGVLLGAYVFEGANHTSSPRWRLWSGLRGRSNSAPDPSAVPREFENGISVAWHRVPFTLGCAGDWTEDGGKQHYDNLCQIDGRIVLAGEHASYIPAWQEGAILSALDAISRLHERVVRA